MARLLAAIFFWVGAMTASATEPTAVLGIAPKVEPGELSRVPNEDAIASRIWMPALDAGFVPQGLTVTANHVLVAAYRSTSYRISRGESRVFAVDMKSGELVGEIRLPDDVGHPGGLANDRRGTLFVADRGKLYRIDLARALADGHTREAVLGRADVDRGIGPSFLAWHAGHLWFGPYEKYGEPRLYRYPVSEVFPEDGNVYLTALDDVHSIPIDVRTQGAAFDAEGRLWLSQSGGDGGVVQRLDPETGDLLDLFAVAAGTEDLSFDEAGTLWSVSEAGSLRWRHWETYFPLIFSLDVARLK
ncbi:MAG: hypothetical protein OXH59_19980 [Rhodospirillaceae bacterium]|nr:hypothetical protein [Rhodospirillaceae bacterium]